MKWKQNLLNCCAGIFILAAAAVCAGWQNSRTTAEPGAETGGSCLEEKERSPAGRLALTFDDGPNSLYTEQLLEGLKERGVRCSFFLLGQRVEENRELVRRMYEEGHLLGNHSYNHLVLNRLTDAEACRQVEKTSRILEEITGEPTTYLRPPYGEWKEELDKRVSMIPVLWSVDSLVWSLKNTEAVLKRVTSSVRDGDIILMHDDYATSVEAALKIVDQLQEEGYEFVTVDELILE